MSLNHPTPSPAASPLENLVACAKRNDSSAWQKIIDLYARQMRQWCIAGQANRNELPDLFREIWSAVYRCIGGFQSGGKFTFHGWLVMLTVNHLRHHYRNQNRDPSTYASALDQLQSEAQVPKASLSQATAPDAELELLKKTALTAVRNAMPTPSVTMPDASCETQANQSPSSSGTVLRDLELGRKLGQGGMGVVYQARHVRLKREVAVKMLTLDAERFPNGAARFEREMEAVGQLDHPNIVRALDAGEENGTLYLVLEYLPGQSLKETVQQRGPLPVAEACRIICQAALGLQFAHSRGITHRDIKPSNLLQTTAGDVKILDFGLARWHDNVDGEFTQQGNILGTPDYMSPEQANDSREVGPASDLFSLGATFYFLLTGLRPFAGDTFAQKVHALHTMTPAPIRQFRTDCPPDVVKIVDQLMAKEPAKRIASAEVLAQRLAPYVTPSESASTESTVNWAASTVAKPRRRWPLMAGGIGLLICLAVLGWLIFGGGSPQGAIVLDFLDGFPADAVVRIDGAEATMEKIGKNKGRVAAEVGEHELTIQNGDRVYRKTVAFKQEDETVVPVRFREYVAGPPQEPKAVKTLTGSRGRVLRVRFGPDGKRAYSFAIAGPNKISVWNLAKHTRIDEIGANFSHALAVSPDGKYLASTSYYAPSLLQLIDMSSKNIVGQIPLKVTRDAMTSCSFSPDSKYVACTTRGGHIAVFHAENQTGYCKFSHGTSAHCCAFSPDSKFLATGGNDGFVRVWDLHNKSLSAEFKAQFGWVSSIRFSNDGKKLFACGLDQSFARSSPARIIEWDLPTGKETHTLSLGANVTCGTVTPNGKYGVIGHDDGTVSIWSLTKHVKVFQRKAHGRYVSCVAVSPNSREALTGGDDNLIWHFQLPSP